MDVDSPGFGLADGDPVVELSAATIDAVCNRVKMNGYFAEPCLVEAGFSKRQAGAMMRRGEELLQEQSPVEAESQDELCLTLVVGVHAAEARWENYAALCWNTAVEAAASTGKGAGANAWKERLERRFPDRYKPAAKERPQVSESPEEFFRKMEEKQKR